MKSAEELLGDLAQNQGETQVLHAWQTQLVDTIHFLHGKGWAPATSSNYSIRPFDSGMFWVSASGIDKGTFGPEHLMQVDRQGKPVHDNRKPSAETLIHCLIYELFPETRCILHTHSVYNTVLSTAHAPQSKVVLEGYEVQKGIRGIDTHDSRLEIPVLPNSQDMVAFCSLLREIHGQNPTFSAFLIAGHGLYTWGTEVHEAKRHIEVIEFLLEVTYKLKTYTA
jgi:methylthioribulose-1-phosphate dehydratase